MISIMYNSDSGSSIINVTGEDTRSWRGGRILYFFVKGLQRQSELVASDSATQSSPRKDATGIVNWGGRNERFNS